MRKRSAIVPAAVLAFAVALTACSSTSSSSPASSSGSSSGSAASSSSAGGNSGGQNITLTMEGFSGDSLIPPLTAEFEKQNPGVTVKFTGLPYPQILTQINTQLVSGTAPDIMTVFPGEGNPITVQTLAKNNYLADLSSSSWVSGFDATKKQVMGVDGKVFFTTNNLTIIPAIYNTQALAAVGAKAPTTYSDVLALCATAKSKGKVAYALGGAAGGNFYFLFYSLTASLVYGPNPNFAADQAAGKVKFTTSQWTAALQKFDDMNKAGCFSKSPLGTSLDVAQGQVAKGDALGIVTVSNQLPSIEEKATSGTTFQSAAFPATDTASDTYLPVGLGAGYGINAKSKNLDMAKKFVDFYMSKTGIQIAVKAGSIFPSVDGGSYTHDAALDGVATQAATGKTVGFFDTQWPNANVNKVFNDETQKLVDGSSSITDILTQMDNAYSE